LTSRREFLAGVASVPLLAPYGAAADAPGSILSKPRIGAEFFLNNGETRDGVLHHFGRMAETGLTIARIFTIWDQIEREQGKWDFWGYDWIYDAAAQNGILIANTLCSEDPPGWMGTAPFYHQWADPSNPQLRPYSEIYIDKVVNRYKNHPAHGVWLLQNEPGISGTGSEPYALAEFARWLQAKYGTPANLNKAWYKQLHAFEDVQVPPTAGWSDYIAALDYRRFRCDHLADQLRWIKSQVYRYHPNALTHGNPPGVLSNMPGSGRDLWKVKQVVDYLGTSIHASHHFGLFGREDFGMAYGFCCDVVRSASPATWWVTELQGGPTMFTGSRHLNPTGTEITRWLWDGIGNGARGIVFWLWHPRTEGNEAGEWGLAGPNGEPTERTRAAQAVAQALKKHEDFFIAAKPFPARAAILYDRDAMILYTVDHSAGGGAAGGRGGGGQPVDEIMHPLIGCYKALHRAHVPADFLDVSELEAGAATRYRVLYLPNCYALSAKSVAAIRDFVRAGGTLWADGLVAWKNEQGVTKQFPPGPLSDVFGFTVEDIQSVWEPIAMSDKGDLGGELWRCAIPAGAGKTLLTGAGGRPTAVEHAFGQGRAIYYGSAVALSYFHRDSAQVAEWIAGPALEASRDLPVGLTEASAMISFRSTQAGERSAAVLNNWGAAGRVTVRFPAGTQSVVEILSGTNVPLRSAGAASEASLELKEGATAVLLATSRS